MSEVNNNYNQVFTSGMTKAEFIENYRRLAAETQSSVFPEGLNEQAIGLIYDTIHISNDEDTLTDNDIETLSALDGDSDNISNEDMVKLYEKIQETYNNTTVTTGSIDSDSTNITPEESLGFLHVLKNIKIQIAETKKAQLQQELQQLVNDSSSISNELKQEFNENTRNLRETETQLKTKQREYDEAQDKILRIKEEISRKQGKIEGTQDETKQAQLQAEIEGLNTDLTNAEQALTPISNEISKLNTSIKKYKSNLSDITNKIERSDSKTAQKIKEKQTELVNIDLTLENEIRDLDTQIQESERLQLEALRTAGTASAHYEDIANGTVSDGTIGKTAAQALANATGEIGVREATGHNDGAQIAKYRNGVDNNAAWCASFVSWCYKGNDVFGYQASVSGIQMAAQRQNLYAEKGTYTPKPGDVMIQKNGASHTGIVESVDPDGTIHTIEGNASNSVRRVTYKPGSKGYNKISGWVKMS